MAFDYIYISTDLKVLGRKVQDEYHTEDGGQMLGRGGSIERCMEIANYWLRCEPIPYGVKYSTDLEIPMVIQRETTTMPIEEWLEQMADIRAQFNKVG